MERTKSLSDTAKYTALTMVGTSMMNNNLFASNSVTTRQESLSYEKDALIGSIPTYQNVTTVVKLKGKEVKIHALCTGAVAVKTNFRTKKGFGELAKVNILLDSYFTEYMPIWVWIIEHPEGIIAIDTGELADSKNIDTFLANESAYSRYISKRISKKIIEKEEELNFQLAKINLTPDDIKLILLTHLHLDHTDGIKFFPKQEIIVSDLEFKKPYSNAPSTYPSWFKPNLVKYKENRDDVFNQAYPVTHAEDVLYVPTPGHTHGHSSIIFKTDDFDIIFAGDTSYNQMQVLRGELAGVNADFKKTKETYKKLMGYATSRKTIYLPSHDDTAGQRLSNKEFLV
jgi:N-acyl homoserine lactone hydrolase